MSIETSALLKALFLGPLRSSTTRLASHSLAASESSSHKLITHLRILSPAFADSSGQNTPGGSKAYSNSPHSYASTPHGLPRSAVPSPRPPTGANNVSPLPPLAPPSPGKRTGE